MSKHHDGGGWTSSDRARTRPIIEATLPAPCVDCGKPVFPHQKWQVGHKVSKAQAAAMGWSRAESNHLDNLGPSHTKSRGQRACNQSAGGRLGRQIQLGQDTKPSTGWAVDW